MKIHKLKEKHTSNYGPDILYGVCGVNGIYVACTRNWKGVTCERCLDAKSPAKTVKSKKPKWRVVIEHSVMGREVMMMNVWLNGRRILGRYINHYKTPPKFISELATVLGVEVEVEK